MTPDEPLSRTTRLINQEYFDGGADEDAIEAGLMTTTARLIADEANVSSRSGQAAFVTAFQLIARMGVGIELIAPEVELLADVAPLRRRTLRAALLDLGADLIPDAVIRSGEMQADVTFAFGDTPCEEPGVIYVTTTDLGCSLTTTESERPRIRADFPLGGLAAGAGAAAIALDAALPRIESATGVRRTSRRRPSPRPPVRLDLARLFPTIHAGAAELGRVDAISGGAVTNALVAVLAWLPRTSLDMRIVDDDIVDISNVNRCTQFRASDADKPKVDVLIKSSRGALAIRGTQARLTAENSGEILPLAERVVVGVDNSEARWLVQELWPAFLYVGATSNREAVLTAHHPGEPCVGCAHPDLIPSGEFVPTISFVSFWAGLLQACALLAEIERPLPARRVTVYPFGLGEAAWGNASELPAGARCAIGCPISANLEVARLHSTAHSHARE